MAELLSLNPIDTFKENLLDFAEEVSTGEVSHAVVSYLDVDGEIMSFMLGEEDITFLIGMLQRVTMSLHLLDNEISSCRCDA